MQKLTTPERIDRMRTLRTERQASMDKRGDAVKTFYAALNAEQKKTFDSRPMMQGRDGHGGKHGGHRGRMHGDVGGDMGGHQHGQARS
jgi:protein CpxP